MMKIAVCDDEKTFRDQIKKCISEVGTDFITDEFECGEDLLASGEAYDIIFLDIDMSGISGIETAEKLRENGAESEIIFLTSHTEYVYEAFKVRAFRFLQKPVDSDKFSEAFRNAVDSCQKEKIVIDYKGNVTEMSVDNIVYIESSGDGTFVYDSRGSYCESPVSLKDWNEKLKDKSFYRIHKAYLVSMKYVSTFEKNSVRLVGYPNEFPVARRSAGDFRAAYLDFIKNNARMM
ncbi:MAG: LytTR family DNA-binding domain-containing protein [Oscillospiraceae bacterium]|nr:LytTR family DNA-binding domain-containing protein [Oscillospiraceae bacterium]